MLKDFAALIRTWRSRHVGDLRIIVFFALFFAMASAVAAIQLGPHLDPNANADGQSIAFIGGVFVVAGGVIAWAYQVANVRLGVVDIFSCEIATLCRVCAVVDIIPQYIKLFDHPAAGNILMRQSEEQYSTIFDNNAKDLSALSNDVTIGVTAFYTYLRAARDALRNLVAVKDGAAGGIEDREIWNGAVLRLLYMMFLALESGRHALDELVEDHDKRTAWTLTILLNELPAYGFLQNKFPPNDIRRNRIDMRLAHYAAVITRVVGDAAASDHLRPLGNEVMQRWAVIAADQDLVV